MPASQVSGISQDMHHSSHMHLPLRWGSFLLASQPFPHGNPTQQMSAEIHFVTSAAWREIKVLQCQCEDIGGGSWGLELGSSPPPRQMCSGLKMMKWRYWRYEGHNDLLQGKGYFLRKKMSWIVFCAGLLCKRKAWLPHKTHSQVWGENQHKTQRDKQEQMRWGMLLLWEWVTHTTDSWCSSNWTTFFYSQAGY